VTITTAQVLAFRPCAAYPAERLDRLLPATLREVLTRLDGAWADVDYHHRIWLAVRILPRPLVRRWLAVIVERALGRIADPDPRSLAVLPYLRRGAAVPANVRTDAYAAYAATAAFPATVAAYAALAAAHAVAAAAFPAKAAYAAVYAALNAADVRQQLADLLKLIEEEGL
jgi:hypothetical protein